MIFDRDDAARPQTHALVIGVGDYPHLRGGNLFASQPAARALGLGQLTSSILSAEAFTRWLVERHRNPAAPLGTVDLLLSPTLDDVQRSFDAWDERCNRHRDGVAAFYFCGHGFVKHHETLLLPSDFGANANRPFAKAIDFTTSWYGMARTRAKTQLYFLDCCREEPIEALETSSHASELKSGKAGAPLFDRAAPVICAAPLGRRAYAPPNDVSFFTRELLRCLDGFAAERRVRAGEPWKVSTYSLEAAMKRAMQRVKLDATKRASCESGPGSQLVCDFHEVDEARVFAVIGVKPAEHLQTMRLSVSASVSAKGETNSFRYGPAADPWEIELAHGVYDISADSVIDGPTVRETGLSVLPPFFDFALEVK